MYVLLCLIIFLFYIIPVYRRPRILKGLLSNEECEYIKDKSRDKLSSSTVGNERIVDENARISETAWLELEDPKIREIAERCLKYTDRPVVNCEKLQVVKYKNNGFYKLHSDVIPKVNNKRLHTFILALNDNYDGGETDFPNINMKYKLKKGDCLMFDNLDNYNLNTSQSLHSGCPVKGEKWIANLWVRIYPYED